MSIEYRGETFSGYNKPKNDRTKTKKFSVLAKSGDTIKLIRYGDANMTIKKKMARSRCCADWSKCCPTQRTWRNR